VVVVVTFSASGAPSHRQWPCTNCIGVTFLGEQAVGVTPSSTPNTGAAHLLEYPVTGSGPPATVPVTGLPDIDLQGGNVSYGTEVLGTVPATGAAPASILLYFYWGYMPQQDPWAFFYHVSAAGKATKYGTQMSGAVGTWTTAPTDGEFPVLIMTEGCGSYPEVLDTASGTLAAPSPPATGNAESSYVATDVWIAPSGAIHAAMLRSPASGCMVGHGGWDWPPDPQPVDFVRQGSGWAKTGSGILQAAYGPGRWMATVTGTAARYGLIQTADNLSENTTMTISDGSPGALATVPDVAAFIWAP
jgi:hypothetical protein